MSDIDYDVFKKYVDAGISNSGRGNRAICVDCHFEPRPGQDDELFEVHAECRPNCPFVKKKLTETNDLTLQKDRDDNADVDIYKRKPMVAEVSQRSVTTMRQMHRCKTCKKVPSCVLFFPCKHLYNCETCAKEKEDCETCKTPIKTKEVVYRS